MKAHKKILSLFLAVCLLAACITMPVSAYSDDTAAQGGYDEMISYFRQHMKNREEDISFKFVTTESGYVEDYNNKSVADLGNVFYNTLYFDIFKTDNAGAVDPFLSDYLYNSLKSAAVVDKGFNEISEGLPAPQYEFDVEFKFEYYSTLAHENYIQSFVRQFSSTYIDDTMNDYQKVKTIYDFVLRNVTYDYDVFHGQHNDTERYLRSHSAYGAICGNLINEGKSEADVKLDFDTILTGEKIIKEADQGLAVCEGYSKLFYVLCVYNGIPCRIVDGDNSKNSGKDSDPHEWNYVYLDDGVKEDGARWYQVDSTFASQASIKEINMNSYDYFLKGSGSEFFVETAHQLPYADFGIDGENTVKEQLYDWYAPENLSSVEDYEISASAITTAVEDAKNGYIIRRITNFGVGKGEQIAYIYTDIDKSFLIAVDENRNVLLEEVEGFDYTGMDSRFDVLLPYMIEGLEYRVGDGQGNENVIGNSADDYNIYIYGKGNTSVSIPFKIVPMDMSDKADNYSERDIQENSPYTGNAVTPKIFLKDGYEHELKLNRDYEVNYYSDANLTQPAEIKNMGTYWCDISFFGNYCGHYTFSFKIGKADLSILEADDVIFTYMSAPRRKTLGINTPADMYVMGAAKLNIGGMLIENNKDYTVSYNGGWTPNGGTITITGVNSSSKVLGGTAKTLRYTVEQLDISNLNTKAYDTGKYYYTGSAVLPTLEDGVDGIIEKNVDYKITGYSDNVNAGEAKVTIEGIGGCKGTAVMTYYINPVAMSKVTLEGLAFNGSSKAFVYTPKFNGQTLVKNVDYTEKVEETSTGYRLTVTGKGNFTNSTIVNINVNKTPTNPSATSSSSSSVPISAKLPNVKKTTLKSLKAKKKSLVVKWKKASGDVSGYRIECSTSKKFNKNVKTVNVYGASKTSYTVKKLKAKKKYYVRIRTFYQKGNAMYLAGYSNVKNKKTK